MPERMLTTRELNRALLARQLLLRRVRLPVARSIERVGALQAQWPPSPYVGLWSRLEGFSHPQLLRAVERRRVVKATLMRETLHHVSTADYLAYAGLFTRARSARIERQLNDVELDRLTGELVAHASELRSRPELLARLGLPNLTIDDRRPWRMWHVLSARAGLVHGPSGSVWRKTTGGSRFVPARVWLGADGGTGNAATAHLVTRYLAAFGPASRADAAQWTGLPARQLDAGLAALSLRRFRDERGRELLDLPRAPLPPAATEAPPRFLPLWDSSLLAHDDRTRILPADYRRLVIARNGDVRPTFLVDGFVAGTWRVEGSRIELEPFERLTRATRRVLEAESRRLAEFHRSAG
jgi:hypothetical protein